MKLLQNCLLAFCLSFVVGSLADKFYLIYAESNQNQEILKACDISQASKRFHEAVVKIENDKKRHVVDFYTTLSNFMDC